MFRLIATLLLFIFASNIYAGILEVRYFQTDARYDYRIELLRLALEKSLATDEQLVLTPLNGKLTHNRGAKLLEDSLADVAFFPTSPDRAKRFLPIEIPILRGILGYRVSLIHKDNLSKFSGIQSLEQLKTEYTAGFGEHWADMKILQDNKLNVIGAVKYESLFKMLSIKRFDYFPRGINEAWIEIEQKGQEYPDLVVEPNIAIYYPYPVYFFVNQTNYSLAKLIKDGLKKALADGSFKALFLKYHAGLFERADLKNRKLFVIENTNLPEGTPAPDTSWWLPEQHSKNLN